MAWSVSHSPIAWTMVRANLRAWTREALVNALCDDRFERAEKAGDLGHALRAVEQERVVLALVSHETLVEECIAAIERSNTCTNGGHAFWIDAKGYHTVPASLTPEGRAGLSDEELAAIRVYAPQELAS